MWVDSHCHIQPHWEQRSGASLDDQLAAAADAGVDWMVCVGTDLASSREAVEIAACHTNVRAAVGLHPHDSELLDAQWPELVELARSSPHVVAIGEAGFDLYYEHSPRDAQERAFRAHIELAHELDRALVIHTRDAWADTFAVLRDAGVPRRTVVHCFTGGPAEAEAALELGCTLSFSGVVSFRNSDEVRAAARITPADRMLVETDAPFLAPVPHRGKPNQPAWVAAVGAALATARDEDPSIVAAATSANALACFGPA